MRPRRAPLLLLLALACARPAPRPPAWTEAVPAAWPHSLTAPVARGERGAVSSDAALATAVGRDVLAAGGNAVDGAVATAFALAVVYPQAGNLGGGGFIVLRTAGGALAALDFRETAPAAATRDMYVGQEGTSLTGHRAAGVPGAVAGLWEAHRAHGERPWREVVEPAIRLAEEGFVVDAELSAAVGRNAARLAKFPASAALFLPGGAPPAVGSRLRNPDLAATLRRIADQGAEGFYRGETAALVVAEMARGGGLITAEDLAGYRARWREPVVFAYRGVKVVSMPPPSSGGLVLALVAGILEGHDVRALGWHSAEHLHLTTEAFRRAYALRNSVLGDPDFVKIPVERFVSPAAAAAERATIGARATPSRGAGPQGGTHTTHLSVVAADGSAVALTTTLNTGYGSAVTVAGAGFVLNNEMDDFTTRPGRPNEYGLIQGEVNTIAPGRRMLSSMTPTLVLDAAGGVLAVTGASGGPTITTAVWQIVSNVVDFGLDPRGAVAAPRVHHQNLPDELRVEANGLRPATIADLAARGHKVVPITDRVGDAPTILRRGQGWEAVEEPRRQGSTAAGL